MLDEMIRIAGKCPVCGRYYHGPMEYWWCPYCGDNTGHKTMRELKALGNRVEIIEAFIKWYEMQDMNEID